MGKADLSSHSRPMSNLRVEPGLRNTAIHLELGAGSRHEAIDTRKRGPPANAGANERLPGRRIYIVSSIVPILVMCLYRNRRFMSLRALIEEIEGVSDASMGVGLSRMRRRIYP